MEGTDELLKLQIDEANFVCKCGIVLERRRFIPHVTLGCLKIQHVKEVQTSLVMIPLRTLPE